MGPASHYFAVGNPFMHLKVLLQYALLGLNQATGFAGGYDYFVLDRTTRDTGKRISF